MFNYFLVKVYLLQQGKKLHKKKTSVKKGEKSPIFNEAIIFNVSAHALQVLVNFYFSSFFSFFSKRFFLT